MNNDPRALKEQALRIRISVLEDRIRMHRMMVRDGWRSRFRPDREANGWLWSALGDSGE